MGFKVGWWLKVTNENCVISISTHKKKSRQFTMLTRRERQNRQDEKDKNKRLKDVIYAAKIIKTNNKYNRVFLNIYWNILVKREKRKMPGRRGRRGGIVIIGSDRRRGGGGQRNFNSRKNQNKRQEMKFYPRGTGLDRQTEKFTKVK